MYKLGTKFAVLQRAKEIFTQVHGMIGCFISAKAQLSSMLSQDTVALDEQGLSKMTALCGSRENVL